MALIDNAWYVDYGDGSTTGYYSVTQWATGQSKSAGSLVRQLAAPSVGSERVFVCVVAGTTHASTEPTWTTTRGAKTTDNTVTWQECTGIAAINGDATNTPNWTTVKGTSITLGQVIKRDSGASYQICTTAGTAGSGSEPAFSDTAGVTTADNTVTWTSLGVVGNFTGWQAPHARLASAFASTWGQAGNSFFVASEHAETQASAMTLTAPGTAASPNYVYCVTKTTVPPVSANLTTGATITTTGANALNLGAGYCIVVGITFNCGSGASSSILTVGSSAGATWSLKNCALAKLGTNFSTGAISLGVAGTAGEFEVYLDNTTLQFGNIDDSLRISSHVVWKNTNNALVGATLPTTLLGGGTITGGVILFDSINLDVLGSGKTLIQATASPVRIILHDCKLGSGVTISPTPSSTNRTEVLVTRSDSSGTNYRHEKYHFGGLQTVETTVVRTGGATDGVTPISWKIVTTANSKWVLPFECLPIAVWNDTFAGNVTVTVYGTWGGGAVPNNDDVWMDAEYLGASGSPLGSFVTVTKADNLAAGTALTSDGSTWGGGTTAFKMVATLSSPQPAQRGTIYVYVKAAKASTTFYIDPKVVLS